MDWTAAHPTSVSFPLWVRVRFLPWICGIVLLIVTTGCAHYPINQPIRQSDPQGGYRAKNFKNVGNDGDMLVMLTFSGGGTRAAAFSYGVLEALRDTEISIHGSKKRMLDEVDLSQAFPAEVLLRPTTGFSVIVSLRISSPVF